MFTLASLVILAQSALFAAVWYLYYRGKIFEPFWNKGNWVLIAMYALLLTLFSRLFGGLRVGYLKRMDDIYSLALAAICSNVVIYLQITLINRWFLSPTPILIMMLVQFGVIVVCVSALGRMRDQEVFVSKSLCDMGDDLGRFCLKDYACVN